MREPRASRMDQDPTDWPRIAAEPVPSAPSGASTGSWKPQFEQTYTELFVSGLPYASGFAMVGNRNDDLGEITVVLGRGTQLNASTKKLVQNVGVGAGLLVVFLVTGWAFLSMIEGWLGVLLWVIVAVPVCFLVEFLLRPRTRQRRSARSLPRMQVRAPVRGDPERAQPTTRVSRDPEFNWHREETPIQRRRRSFAGR